MITQILTVLDAAAEAMPVGARYRWASLVAGRPHVHVGNGDFVPVAEDAAGSWSYWRAMGPAQVSQADIGEACIGYRVTMPLRFVAWVDREECTPAIMDAVNAMRASRRDVVAAIGAADVQFDRIAWQVDGVGGQEFRPEPVWPTHKMLVNIDITLVVEADERCVQGCGDAVSVLCRLMGAATLEQIRECLGDRINELCDLDCQPATYTVNGTPGTPIPSGGNAVLQVLQGGVQVGTFDPVTGVHTVPECPEGCTGPLTLVFDANGTSVEVAVIADPCDTTFVLGCDTLVDAVVVEGAGSPEANGLYLPDGEFNGETLYRKDADTSIFAANPEPDRFWVIRTSSDGDLYVNDVDNEHPWDVLTWFVNDGISPAPAVRQATLGDLYAAFCNICPEPEPCPIDIEVRNGIGDVVDSANIPDPCEQEGPVVLTAPDATPTWDGVPWGAVPSGSSPDINCDSLIPAAYVQDGGSKTGTYKVDGTVNGKDRYRLDGSHTLEYNGTQWVLVHPGPNEEAAPGNEDFPWEADWSGTGITVTQASIAQYCDQCDPPTLCEQLADVAPENAQEEILDCVTPSTLTAIEDILFPLGDAIIYQGGDLLSSGQNTVYRAGDEGTMNADGRFSYNPTIGRNTIRQRIVGNGSIANWSTLVNNNIHGNTNRFTNRSGGAPATTGNRIIQDHLTGWEWYVPSSLATLANWNTAINNGVALNTTLSETGWYLPNDRLLDTITYDEPSIVLNYGGFLVTVNLWTSSTQPNSTTLAKYLGTGGQIGAVAKTSNAQSAIFCRRFS